MHVADNLQLTAFAEAWGDVSQLQAEIENAARKKIDEGRSRMGEVRAEGDGVDERSIETLTVLDGVMDALVAAYDEAAMKIRRGTSAAVFAEGTRTRTGELLAFKRGPFVLAIRAGVPVVPVWIGGTFEMLPRGSLRLRPGEVVVRLGEPIPTADLTHDHREQLAQEARGAVARLAAGDDGSGAVVGPR